MEHFWYIGRASSGASTLYKSTPGEGNSVISVPATHDLEMLPFPKRLRGIYRLAITELAPLR